jgi:hypothetical protein
VNHPELIAAYAALAVDNLLDDVPEWGGPPPLASGVAAAAYADVIAHHRDSVVALAVARHAALCVRTEADDPRTPGDLVGADDPCGDIVDDAVYALNLP